MIINSLALFLRITAASLLLLVGIATRDINAAPKIYHWTDDNGTEHYTDTPPTHESLRHKPHVATSLPEIQREESQSKRQSTRRGPPFLILLCIIGAIYLSGLWEPYYEKLLELNYRLKYINPLNARSRKKRERQFLELTVSMIAKMAKADGVVSKAEIKTADNFFSVRLKLNSKQIKETRLIFNSAKDSNRSFESYAEELYKAFHNKRDVLRIALAILRDIALAGGKLTAEEEQLLVIAREKFSIPGYSTSEARSDRSNEHETPLQILGCKKGASKAEIKKQYRKLVKETHPDKLRAQGMSEEFISIARERFLKIQKAYESLEATF